MFIGRKRELARLVQLMNKRTASFVVLKGRRRIGKSRLIEEFGKKFEKFYEFSGLPPEGKTTTKDQIDSFSRQISREFNVPKANYDDWGDVFWDLGDRLKSGKVLLLFDEISWMGSKDPTFLGKIKNFWDLQLKRNDKLIFVVCGSASSWIDKNILSSTGFVGRVSLTLTLRELDISACSKFWPKNISAYEKLKVLSVTGGIPKYLEEVIPHETAEENINRLCFQKEGFLVEEFKRLFSDVFMRKSNYYKLIVEALVNGPKSQSEISELIGINRHGRVSEYLDELELCGFVSKDYSWDFKTGYDSKTRKYRLIDNYLRFYLKCIEPNLSKIQRDFFAVKSVSSMSQWSTIVGLQFENLVLSNRSALHKAIYVSPEEIISENPYFQKKTARAPGCQIDYLIQTRFETLYVIEIKFSKSAIGSWVIKEVQEKIDKLKRPKGFSCRPVLVHVNGVTEQLLEENYFANIVDLSQFLSSV